jgi:hypothetical protein
MTAPTGGDPLRLVPQLIEIGEADTVYRDVYLARARTLLGSTLSLAEYRQREQMAATVDELPLRIQRAVEQGRWVEVKELSATLQAMRTDIADKRALMKTAERVYAVTDVVLDPFSPGLQEFRGFSPAALVALRKRSVEQLADLERADAAWSGFYAARQRAFEDLAVAEAAREERTAVGAPAGDVRAAALEALKSGNMRSLQALAQAAMDTETGQPRARGLAPRGRRRPPPRWGLVAPPET